jgi:sugar (pentulose or hexulose) kinase
MGDEDCFMVANNASNEYHKRSNTRIFNQGDDVAERCTVVVDVGKTNAKVSLWDAGGALVSRRTRANKTQKPGYGAPGDRAPGYRALDVAGIDAWLMHSLRAFAQERSVARIIPVAHGAAAVLLRAGRLFAAPVDYEEEVNVGERAEYDAQRDPFGVTGSPALPCGLNLGLQLHCLEKKLGPLPGDVVILPWAQYWAWRLCGVAASEVTSLGCHTDLWQPIAGGFTTLAEKRGWSQRMAPVRGAGETLGTITPDIAHQTGLPADCVVLCGLHDSNAALLAARGYREIATGDATVLSTGTWFVAMRSLPQADSIQLPVLDEHRDCLLNVDVANRPVPSARFMGGREVERIGGLDSFDLVHDYRAEELLSRLPPLIASGACAYPSFAPGVGPFPHGRGEWYNKPADARDQRAIAEIYLALMADTALDLIGSRDCVLVEGRFAEAVIFVRALAALRPQQQIFVSNAHQDVAYGALRLVDPQLAPPVELAPIKPLSIDLSEYAAQWRARASAARGGA